MVQRVLLQSFMLGALRDAESAITAFVLFPLPPMSPNSNLQHILVLMKNGGPPVSNYYMAYSNLILKVGVHKRNGPSI